MPAGPFVANINAAADGDQTVIAATASRNIRITGGCLVLSGAAGTVILRSATTNVAVATFTKVGAASDLVVPLSDLDGADVVQGEGLEINNGAGIDTTGFISYTLY